MNRINGKIIHKCKRLIYIYIYVCVMGWNVVVKWKGRKGKMVEHKMWEKHRKGINYIDSIVIP